MRRWRERGVICYEKKKGEVKPKGRFLEDTKVHKFGRGSRHGGDDCIGLIPVFSLPPKLCFSTCEPDPASIETKSTYMPVYARTKNPNRNDGITLLSFLSISTMCFGQSYTTMILPPRVRTTSEKFFSLQYGLMVWCEKWLEILISLMPKLIRGTRRGAKDCRVDK